MIVVKVCGRPTLWNISFGWHPDMFWVSCQIRARANMECWLAFFFFLFITTGNKNGKCIFRNKINSNGLYSYCECNIKFFNNLYAHLLAYNYLQTRFPCRFFVLVIVIFTRHSSWHICYHPVIHYLLQMGPFQHLFVLMFGLIWSPIWFDQEPFGEAHTWCMAQSAP